MSINRRAGFTLVELLIVVAIIAVMAAMLHPVLLNARAKGRQAACLSNTKQIAVATILYSDDNSGYLPLIWTAEPRDPWDNKGYGTRWYHRLWPYIRSANRDVFKCPAAHVRPTYSNYSCNPSMQNSRTVQGRLVTIPWRMNDVRIPSRRAFVGDGVPHRPEDYNAMQNLTVPPGDAAANFRYWTGYPIRDYLDVDGDLAPTPDTYARQVDYRHNNGSNFAMLDGHSKWITRGSLQEYNWWHPAEIPGVNWMGN